MTGDEPGEKTGATTPGATTPGATTPGATTPGATTPGATQAVGTLADEAAQLLDAVAARLADYRAAPVERPSPSPGPGPTAMAGDNAPGRDTAPADDSAKGHTCVGWCPICRSADLMRGDRSEVIAKLLDTALVMVTTLRSLIPEPAGRTASGPRQSPAPGSSPQPGIERIDIR